MISVASKKINRFVHSGTTNSEMSEREKQSAAIARRAAAESIVLLKNEGLLPLRKGMHLALLGGGAQFTVKGGTGSGDVHPRKSVSVLEGMLNKGFDIVSRDWLADYERRYHNARQVWRDMILGDGSEKQKRISFLYTRIIHSTCRKAELCPREMLRDQKLQFTL